MKQTKSAITFLAAQYRAIFKHAFFKGLVSATVLTAGLAAGAAQAETAPSDWYISSGESTDWLDQTDIKTDAATESVAGQVNLIKDGTATNTVSGGNIIVGTPSTGSAHLTGTANKNVYGGYGSFAPDAQNSATLDFTDNHVTLNSSSSVSGSLYGAFGNNAAGAASASGNSVTINARDSGTLSIGGDAYNESSAVAGAKLTAEKGAVATNNKVIISGSSATAQIDLSKKGVIAGAWVKSPNEGTTATGDYIVRENSVDLDYVSAQMDAAGHIYIYGGQALTTDESPITSLQALGNTVDINQSKISIGVAGGSTWGNRIVGNNVNFNIATPASESVDVTASGIENSAVPSVKITNSTLSSTSKTDQILVAGGFAYTSRGSATANFNSVELDKVNMDKTTVFGSALSATGTAESKNNSVIITGESGTTTISDLSVYGSRILGAPTSVTANGNSVEIGDLDISLGAKKKANAGIFGSFIELNVTDSSKITANNNSVIFNGKVTGNKEGQKIAAVVVENEGSLSSGKYASFSGNSVTIGDGAEVNNIDIAAVYNSGSFASVLNNKITLEVGSKVSNGNLIGGQGKDSVIQVDGEYSTVDDSENVWLSDVINVNGLVKVVSDSSLSIGGYFSDGKSGTKTLNPNLTTIGTGATISNAGAIQFLGHTTIADGAVLSAQTAGAVLSVDGDAANQINVDPNIPIFLPKDGAEGAGYAELSMSLQQAKNYLSENEVKIGDAEPATDKKGTIAIANRGTMHFTDSTVTLSSFEFLDQSSTSSTPESTYGKFVVDDSLTATSGSIFKADSITLEHQLVKSTTASDLLGQANAATSTGIILDAKNLTLGSSKINADQSQAITFGYATVSESLNFANVKQGTTTKTATFNLTSNINLSAYQESITTEEANTHAKRDPVYNPYGDLVFYSPKAGSINGDVILTQTSATNTGILHVENGNWTAADSITMDSGSQMIIGVDSAYASSYDTEGLLTDATLTLNNALVIKSDNGTTPQSQTITVKGNDSTSEYNFDAAADAAKDGRYYKPLAQLDLRKGLEVVENSADSEVKGKATISVVSGGVLLLDGSDLSTILAQNDKTNSKGVLFSAADYGKIIVEGEITADFKDFADSNSVDIDLGGTGIFEATKLTLENDSNTTGAKPNDSDYLTTTATAIDFNGTVRLDDLSISDRTLTVKEDSSESLVSQVTIKSGDIKLAKSLTAVNDTLVLGEAGSAVNLNLESGFVADEGILSVKNLKSVSGTITVANGQWTGENTIVDLAGTTALTVGSTFSEVYDANDELYMPSLTAKGLTAAEGSKVAIEATGTATFDQLNLDGAAGDYSAGTYTKGVVVKGNLVINGDDTLVDDEGQDVANNGVTFGTDGSIVVLNGGVLSFGAAATNGAIIDDNYTSGTATITEKDGFGKITVLGGDVELGLSESVFSSEALTELKKYLFTSGSLDSTGVLLSGSTLNIGNATFSGLTGIKEDSDGTGYTIAWADYKQFSDVMSNNMDVTNNQLKETDVTDISSSDSVRGNVGSFTLATGNNSVEITGNTSLSYAAGNNGFFISQAGDAKAGNATVASGKVLRLINGGHIGTLTLKSGEYNITDSGLTTLRIEGGDTYIEQIKGESNLTNVWVDIQSNTSVAKEIKNIDYVEVSNALLSAADGMSVNELMVNATAGVEASGESVINEDLIVEGGKASFEQLTLNSSSINKVVAAVYNGGTAKFGKLIFKDANTVFNVGADEREFDQDMLDAGLTGTGYLEITGEAELNNGTLFVDPAYDEKTSLAAVAKFHSDVNETTTDLGVQDGNIVIGKNAAVGIGTNLADLHKAISAFQDDESLQADKYGSILYLNGQLDISDGAHVTLNSDASLQTLTQVDQLRTFKNGSTTMTADFALSDNSAIVMTDKVFWDQQGQKTETAIHFEKDNAKVYSEGADIVLQGSFATGETLHIFSDLGGNGDKGTGVDLYGQNINVYTQNGFLFGTIETGLNVGDVSLKVDEDRAFNIMSEASVPVVESLIAYGNRGLTQTEPTPEQPSTSEGSNGEADPDANPVAETNVSTFLDQIITTTNGAPAESAARLAIYGGAVQSVLVANNSNAELISSRMDVGAQNSALTFSDNGQGAGLWVAPLYKSQETDSLGSQGLNYGVDISMYGLALGGDYTLGNGMRLGAMFSVGSGDADGQGNTAAAGTSNDFDYWGISVYGGYAINALTITADLGYTVVDNTLEASTSLQDYSKLTASTDSSALTFGVTGQYKFDVNGMVVAPHAGLRYTNIDLDNYTVDGGHEDVAHYNANSMSVFSIPVGVTLSKDIVAGAWTIKPSFDLTLTANMGDDTIDGSVEWTGTKDLKTNVESEVLDTFTYGATVGVAAKTGNFSLGVGLNYTGASNTEEYGVNANVRFVF